MVSELCRAVERIRSFGRDAFGHVAVRPIVFGACSDSDKPPALSRCKGGYESSAQGQPIQIGNTIPILPVRRFPSRMQDMCRSDVINKLLDRSLLLQIGRVQAHAKRCELS